MTEDIRRSWWTRRRIILAVAIGLILSLATAATWKWCSDADLRAVDERARAMGIPASWSAFAGPLSPQVQLARWNRIVKHHQELNLSDVAELLADIDALCAEPLQLCADARFSQFGDAKDHGGDLAALLGRRVRLADRESIEHEARRTLRLIDTIRRSTTTSDHCRRLSLLADFCADCEVRIDDLRRGTPEFADELERIADSLAPGLRELEIGEFLTQRQFFQDPDQDLAVFRDLVDLPITMPIALRLGRRRVLESTLDRVERFSSKKGLFQLAVELKRLNDEAGAHKNWDSLFSPGEFVELLFTTSHFDIIHDTMITELRLRLMVAELRGGPWPIDCFDPVGRPVRRIEIAGKQIAAYSVGENGIDDGGDKQLDYVWPLSGLIDPPKEAP